MENKHYMALLKFRAMAVNASILYRGRAIDAFNNVLEECGILDIKKIDKNEKKPK